MGVYPLPFAPLQTKPHHFLFYFFADLPLSWEVTSCTRTFFEIGLDISDGRDDTTEAEAIAVSKGHTGNPEEEKSLVSNFNASCFSPSAFQLIDFSFPLQIVPSFLHLFVRLCSLLLRAGSL